MSSPDTWKCLSQKTSAASLCVNHRHGKGKMEHTKL